MSKKCSRQMYKFCSLLLRRKRTFRAVEAHNKSTHRKINEWVFLGSEFSAKMFFPPSLPLSLLCKCETQFIFWRLRILPFVNSHRSFAHKLKWKHGLRLFRLTPTKARRSLMRTKQKGKQAQSREKCQKFMKKVHENALKILWKFF